MFEIEVKIYLCTNDACARLEKRVPVFRDQEAVCSNCGWFMSAEVPESDD